MIFNLQTQHNTQSEMRTQIMQSRNSRKESSKQQGPSSSHTTHHHHHHKIFATARHMCRALTIAAVLVVLLSSSMRFVAAADDAGIEGGDHDRLQKLRERKELDEQQSRFQAQQRQERLRLAFNDGRRHDPPWSLFLTCAVSHITIWPTMQLFWRRRWMYEMCLCIGGLICSFMYHTCQAFQAEFFLTELKWHLLDNVFVICNFAGLFTYIAIFKDGKAEFLTKSSAMFVALLTQIRSPWEISHTVIPIGIYASIPILSFVFVKRCSVVYYDLKCAAVGIILLAIAVPFFVLGLDDDHDPYRIFHGLWHLFIGISAYYMWRIVKQPIATNLQSIIFAENSAALLTRFRSEV